MRLLLDTHILVRAVVEPGKLSALARELILDSNHELLFSTVSIWETAIKFGPGYADFNVEPGRLRQTLLESDYRELPVFGEHVVAVTGLPFIHKDPFDRLLIAQSVVEGIILLTADLQIARYGGLIQKV
jgi:PIN domain nuclease of toxin-antitoxin system